MQELCMGVNKTANFSLTCLMFVYLVCRNVLVESARIARGKISPLSQLKASGFDAVIFPGGFGAAKNLLVFNLVPNFIQGLLDPSDVI